MRCVPIALVGPMACYADSTHDRHRQTALRPTKSAVTGLIGACLGRDRADDQRDLYALRVHLRADQVGVVTTDLQTQQRAWRANGTTNPDTFLLRREYLQGGAYLAVAEGPDALVTQIEAALRDPHFLPYLGTRTCLPSRPVYVAPSADTPALDLLRVTPLLAGPPGERDAYLEDPDGPFQVDDQPLPGRRFTARYVTPVTVTVL